MDVADEAKRRERRVPRLPFLFDRRVFGGVLFGQERFAQRDLGREASEEKNQIWFHVYVTTKRSAQRHREAILQPFQFHNPVLPWNRGRQKNPDCDSSRTNKHPCT